MTYSLDYCQVIPKPLEEVFPFFSEAKNLERITPSFLSFKVIEDKDLTMHQGLIINYKLKLYGIPFRWKTEITKWEPPYGFVDSQIEGPYKSWIHEHTFKALDAHTTEMQDHIEYDHAYGKSINKLFVGPNVKKIFAYRFKVIEEIMA